MYGANRSLINLILGLRQLGVNPIVIVPIGEGPLLEVLTEKKIRYKELFFTTDFINKDMYPNGRRGIFVHGKMFFKNILNARKVAGSLRNENVDLIYSNSSVFYTGHHVSFFLNKPHIWHVREFAKLQYNLSPLLGENIFQYFIKRAASIIFVSECLRQFFSFEGDSKAYVVYNGVAPECVILKYRDRNKIVNGRKFQFCIVGQVTKDKGQLEAIKAFQLVRKKYNVKLIIAGGGDRNFLEEYVAAHGIPDVEFLGEVKEPFKIFEESHVSLMCSKNEAMGRVTVESMCFKTPVIGYDNGGTSELIQDGKTGLLYRESYTELAEKMELLIENKILYNSLAENAWEWALKNCSQENYAKSVFEIIKPIKNTSSFRIPIN